MNCAGNRYLGSNWALQLLLAALLWLSFSAAKLAALPSGAEVVAGEASISQQGPVLQVEQSSQRAIINYQDFTIAAQETVNFNQPNAQAVVLNRVVGGNLAEIYGHMNANGQVYLINPNGVLVGQGAQLNVGGLLLTTLDIAQEDFLAGRDALAGASSGRVENQGAIDASGQVILVAPEVINGGSIRAPHGEVALQAANRALLQTPGSGIPILVDEAQVSGQVINTGRIEAVAVRLGSAGDYGPEANPAISNTGVVRAVRASGAGGVIELLAPGGEIANSGSLDASASHGAGGAVTAQAEYIANSGHVSASAAGGAGDGGAINLQASDSLALFGASQLSADGAGSGKGGEVLVVAEKDAWFTTTASISARSGEISGDGGFVEFSGHRSVDVNGWVDVNAVNGKAGIWYIDPTDIVIANLDSGGSFTGGNPHTWVLSGPPATSRINVVSIRNALTSGDVIISTASGAASVGNITWNGNLDVNGLGTIRTLSLTANGTVSFQSGSIWDSNLATATDGLNINVTAGTGITVTDGVGINSTIGKINFIATTGDATITGLGSTANAADAIQVTASAGRIVDGGDVYYDTTALVGNGGVVLSARDGIDIETNANTLSLLSSNGNVSVVNLGAASVSQLSALTTSYLAASSIQTNNATVFGGSNVQLYATGNIVLPSNGLTVTGNLTLQGNDIVDQNASRTLSVGANHLTVNSSAAGGNSIFNTAVNQLSVSNVSTNSLTFNDVDALTTVSISPFSGTTTINSGAGTDLTVGSQIELNDETGALTFNAGKNLIVNGAVADSIGAISNNNALSFTAANNIIFNAGAQANAGAGSVALSVTNGNITLGGPIAGATMTVSAAGAAGGNITSNASMDLNGFGGVRTLNLNASGVISFTGGTIADSDTSSASDGLNINATAGTGFSVSGNTLLSAGAGKINITATLGNASVTGLSSSANAADAIRITASGGSIIDGGDSRTDISATSGGAILSGQFGITALETDVSVLDALSAAGDISLTEAGGLSISRLSALDSSSLTAGGAILTTNSTVFGGNDLNLITSSYIQVPQLGISMPDLVLLQAADVRAESAVRTVSLSGQHVFVDTASSGGNLQINSTTNLLTLKNTGSNTITLNDTDALLLASVRPQGGSTVISSGAGSNLTLANAPIELDGSNGVLTLNAGADLIINQSAEDTIGAVNNATTINLNATNNVTFTSGGRVNAGTGTVAINASGGSVALGRVDAASTTVTAAPSYFASE
ncbi:MAG TPA: filamentous hemagglutinin N-terminal domain-containing protein [Cellvibrionaceae bacterium]|nr:filamentous hemagglutinin N-terminal domain-containing protein [Cellvibrionaceae bacterium]